MSSIVVLVSDKIYLKTRRYINKLKLLLKEDDQIWVAVVSGFSEGLPLEQLTDCTSGIISGSVNEIADQISLCFRSRISDGMQVKVLALNQSSILPALALRRLLGLTSTPGYLESCDKRRMRHLLSANDSDLSVEYCEAIPGQIGSASNYFYADRYVVKPAYGMSSADVKFFDSWDKAKQYAESKNNAKSWVPSHVMAVLDSNDILTNTRLIEPYIDGAEFSIDGWISGDDYFAIVQHKLCMVQRTFIGDGPTVSPPIISQDLPNNWTGLNNTEDSICKFGHRVLKAIGFSQGVFHIEGKEHSQTSKLFVIEINPRSPGGSLWKSALYRTGYDLELLDANIQLGRPIPPPLKNVHNYVLHYPFYANNPGVLVDWGGLNQTLPSLLSGISIDFAAQLGDVIKVEDMSEEPYLAFAVTGDNSLHGILSKCEAILNLPPPIIFQSAK